MPTNDEPDAVGTANAAPALPRRRLRNSQCGIGGNRIFGAVFIIIIGVAFFLDNMGILRFQDIWRFWPVYILGVGVVKASSGRTAQDRSWGVILLVAGSLCLAWNLGLFHLRGSGFNWAMGLLLVGLGIRNLLGATHPNAAVRGFSHGGVQPEAADPNRPDSEPVVSSVVIFGSSKRRVESLAFRGGDAQAIFGNVEFDLRMASIQPGTDAVVDAQSIFGSVKFRVPYQWRVSLQVQGVFGSAEDKTIPDPRGSSGGGPLLIVTGTYLFGSIEVEN